MKVNDVVVIIADHPAGVTENVSGRIGVITDVFDDGVAEVKDILGDEYHFASKELRNANDAEIREAFIMMLKAN